MADIPQPKYHKVAYFTVDDCPSQDMVAKVAAVVKRRIPSIWFVRGEYVDKNGFDGLVYAIQQGALLGNHSYSHPLFSRITPAQWREEIARTEALIDEAYRRAGQPRPVKVFRFPFGDRGAGRNALKQYKPAEQAVVDQLQGVLKEFGFKRCIFDGITYKYWSRCAAIQLGGDLTPGCRCRFGELVDAGVSYDVGEYQTIWESSRTRSGLHTLADVLKHMKKDDPEDGFGLHSPSADVVLMHDFTETTPMWEPLLDALMASVTEWRMPKFAS